MTPPNGATAVVDGVGATPASLPVVLLPVRIETRYIGTDLLVRVYPDRWHQYSHVVELTADEAVAGAAVWGASGDDRLTAWGSLCRLAGTPRATWVVRATAPGRTIDAGRGTSWDRPVVARGLPDRWVVAGYGPVSNGTDPSDQDPIVVAVGADILNDLAIGPTPGAVSPASEPVHVDAGMAWLVDLDEALRVGMAIRVPNPPELARLVVVGLRAAADGTAGAALLNDLLVGHTYTDGLSFVAQATATNAEQPAAAESDQTTLDRALSSATSEPASDGFRLACALGVDPATLAGLRGADGHENQDAQAANALLWNAGWGDLQSHRLGSPPAAAASETMRQHFVDYVRARGPLSAVRIADQPFGVLPVLKQDLQFPSPGEDPTLASLGVWLRELGPVWRAAGAQRLADSLSDSVRRTPRPVSYYARAAWRPVPAIGWFADVTHFMGLTRQQVIAVMNAREREAEQASRLVVETFSWSGPPALLPDAPADDPTTAILVAGPGGALALVPPPDAVGSQLSWFATAAAADLRDDQTGLDGVDSLLRILLRASLLHTLERAQLTTPPASGTEQPIAGRLDGLYRLSRGTRPARPTPASPYSAGAAPTSWRCSSASRSSWPRRAGTPGPPRWRPAASRSVAPPEPRESCSAASPRSMPRPAPPQPATVT